jgi:hypothetical protein
VWWVDKGCSQRGLPRRGRPRRPARCPCSHVSRPSSVKQRHRQQRCMESMEHIVSCALMCPCAHAEKGNVYGNCEPRQYATSPELPQRFTRCTAVRLREPTTGPPRASCSACSCATAARSAMTRPPARPPARAPRERPSAKRAIDGQEAKRRRAQRKRTSEGPGGHCCCQLAFSTALP